MVKQTGMQGNFKGNHAGNIRALMQNFQGVKLELSLEALGIASHCCCNKASQTQWLKTCIYSYSSGDQKFKMG